jgi:hypothetical protein
MGTPIPDTGSSPAPPNPYLLEAQEHDNDYDTGTGHLVR